MQQKRTNKYSTGYSNEYYLNPQGQWHGPYKTFSPNSHKDWEGYRFNGRNVGVWKFYNNYGKMYTIDTYKNGGIKIDFKY